MGKAVKAVTGKVFGGGGSPGMMGTGRFKGTTRKTDTTSFKEKLSGAGTQEELRKKQAEQSGRLEDRATGKAPSIAEAQLKQATNRSLKQQLAGAQSRRGGSAASRERELAVASANSTQNIAEAASTAKLQEQQLAESSLAQQLAGQRSQDISLADSDRASGQALENLETKQHLGAQGASLSGFQSAAANRGNFASGLAQGGMAALSDEDEKINIKDESLNLKSGKSKKEDVEVKSGGFEGQAAKGEVAKKKDKGGGGGAADLVKLAPLLAAMSDKNNKKNVSKVFKKMKDTDPKSVVKKEDKKSMGSKFAEGYGKGSSKFSAGDNTGKSALANAAASISDEDKKKNVEDANPQSFLDALTAYSYDYKDPKQAGAGEGRHLSVMAQDLEKAGPVGKSMVKDTPQGKMVDYGKGFGAMLASQAHLNEKIKSLEGKKKK